MYLILNNFKNGFEVVSSDHKLTHWIAWNKNHGNPYVYLFYFEIITYDFLKELYNVF